MTILIQSLIGLFTIGPIPVFLFAWFLIAKGHIVHTSTIGGETSLDVRGGRIRFHHGKPRFLMFTVSFYNYESDVKLTVGLWFFTIWIEFSVGTIFSPAQRTAFYARWGSYLARVIGVSCHHSQVFFSLWKRESGWHVNDPKWEQFSIRLPWDREWLKTEVLDQEATRCVWWETPIDRKHMKEIRVLREQQAATVTRKYNYRYITRMGVKQRTAAAVHVCRVSSGWHWLRYPFNVDTYIDVVFSPPIGDLENTVHATYGMNPGESAFMTLRKMELIRKFRD